MIDSIFAAYLLIYSTFSFLKAKNWLRAHQKTMSVLAFLFLIYIVFNMIQLYYTGNLEGYLIFYQRALEGISLMTILGQALVFIFPIVNLFSKNRTRFWLQIVINVLIFVYLVVKYSLSDFLISVAPGWHTTIYPSLSVYSVAIAIGVFLLFDMVWVRAKFKKKD